MMELQKAVIKEAVNVACYCRVSTKKEEQEMSLENQQIFFETYTKNHNMKIYKIYKDDGISAKSMKKRDDFNRMVQDAKKGLFKKILVKDVSRFARNTYEFLGVIRELRAKGIEVLFVTANMSTLDSDLTLTILAAVAQEESSNLSKRVKFAKKISAKNGRVPTLVYGYDKVKDNKYELTINPNEANVVRRVFELYINEQMSCRKIAALLNTEKIPTKRGGNYQWSQTVISNMLKNQLYIGIVCNHKSEVMDFMTDLRIKYQEENWLKTFRPEFRIISDETFAKANAIIASRSQSFSTSEKKESTKQKRSSIKYPLSNLLVCSNDHYAFRRRSRSYKSGRAYTYWSCSKRDSNVSNCDNAVKIDEKQMHQAISEFLLSMFNSKEAIVRIFTQRFAKAVKQQFNDEFHTESLKAEQKKLEARKDKLLELYLDNELDKNVLKDRIMPIDNRIEEINKIITLSEHKEKIYYAAYENIKELIVGIEDNFIEMLDNIFLKALFEEFKVQPDGEIKAILKTSNDYKDCLQIPFCRIEN